jgi:hypothetical protein
MDVDNILSEVSLGKLFKSIIPNIATLLKNKSNKSFIKDKEQKMQDLKKEKQKVDKEFDDILISLEKKLKRDFPDKYKKRFKQSVMGI